MEGLASIFEAEGMMSQRSTLKPSDLINRSRWDQWNHLSQDLGSTSRIFEQMLIDDRFFQQHPSEAYAVAWAVSLYLAERDTKSYISLLRHYSKMDIGQETSAGQRISDFKVSSAATLTCSSKLPTDFYRVSRNPRSMRPPKDSSLSRLPEAVNARTNSITVLS